MIHPFWLTIKDTEVQSKYDLSARKNLAAGLYFGFVIVITFVLITKASSQKPLEDRALESILFGSFAASIAICSLAVKLHLAAIDFCFFANMGVQSATTFFLLY